MEIFKYLPDSAAIARRLGSFGGMAADDEPSRKNPIENLVFKLKSGAPGKKQRASTLCDICKEGKHLPSMCPKRPVAREAQEKTKSHIYRVELVLSPTSVRLANIPKEMGRQDIRELLEKHGLKYDTVSLVHDKGDTAEFKGIVFINYPTREEAEKCVDKIDGVRLGIQIVSASIVESQRPYS